MAASIAWGQEGAPKAVLLDTAVVSTQSPFYQGWPTLAIKPDGELLLVCSGGREAHVCPFGRVDLFRSRDGGKTWTWPQTLLDGPLDDRDAGLLVTPKGSLLVTTFTSLAYEPILAAAEKKGNWKEADLRAWQSARDRISPQQRKKDLGVWMIRSTDGGITWSARQDCLVNSPHGPIALGNGDLLYAGKDLWRDGWVGVCHSTDDGVSWKKLAAIPVREGDDAKNYHELHAIDAGGVILVHIRNHNKANERETLQSESTDGGKTWSTPHAIGVWGLPSHLLKLKDGRILMSYGHRRKPFGNQARLSSDKGKTWSQPILLSTDGVTGDLGYPSTVERNDGSLSTAWYEVRPGNPKAVLRIVHWKLP
ncbi:MAG: exo-alpha-sialidase [Gemmataceae bacterium]|nr:exo-alpha-sialidase [Gemmataceae bacterium]